MKHDAGFSLIEAILAVTIISFSIMSAVLTVQTMAVFERETLNKRQALAFLDQGVELVRVLRDSGWSTTVAPLSDNISYYFTFTGSTWQATTTPVIIGEIWYRTVIFERVYRDGAGRISSSGMVDPNTRLATVYVSWQGTSGTSTVSSRAYTTNLFDE